MGVDVFVSIEAEEIGGVAEGWSVAKPHQRVLCLMRRNETVHGQRLTDSCYFVPH